MSVTKKRISVFTGHYGSGKTEISINYAVELKNEFNRVALVDLDIVNPYFRSREARKVLEERGITVVASVEQYFDTDLPALSPAITGVLKNTEITAVVDLGGDHTGARVIGRFRNQIDEQAYEMFFVVNPFRPFTSKVSDIQSVISEVEAASRLKVTALVSNPNLLRETTTGDIAAGHRVVMEAAAVTGLPVKFISVVHSLAGHREVKNLGRPVLTLKRLMLVPWEKN
ncbi:MAG: hypothetical protein ACYC21_09610 [Eubacteriales bacterium]